MVVLCIKFYLRKFGAAFFFLPVLTFALGTESFGPFNTEDFSILDLSASRICRSPIDLTVFMLVYCKLAAYILYLSLKLMAKPDTSPFPTRLLFIGFYNKRLGSFPALTSFNEGALTKSVFSLFIFFILDGLTFVTSGFPFNESGFLSLSFASISSRRNLFGANALS